MKTTLISCPLHVLMDLIYPSHPFFFTTSTKQGKHPSPLHLLITLLLSCIRLPSSFQLFCIAWFMFIFYYQQGVLITEIVQSPPSFPASVPCPRYPAAYTLRTWDHLMDESVMQHPSCNRPQVPRAFVLVLGTSDLQENPRINWTLQ